MKNIYYALISIVLIPILIIGCTEEEPVALFSTNKTSAEVDEEIIFSNKSTFATNYFWDFGDSNTSTDENPTHTFSEVGTYTVTLTATGEGGENSTSKTITIAYPKPVANFTINKTTFELGEEIIFENNSENSNSYFWNFGDSNTSTDENPTHSYSLDGQFEVKLVAAGDGGKDSTSKVIEINPLPFTGKWELVEVIYNSSLMSSVSGYIDIIDEENFEADFKSGSNSAYVKAKYVMNSSKFISNMNGEPMVLNGVRSASTCCPIQTVWSASISCSQSVFNWGKTAIAYDSDHVLIEISGYELFIESSDGKTKITYEKEL